MKSLILTDDDLTKGGSLIPFEERNFNHFKVKRKSGLTVLTAAYIIYISNGEMKCLKDRGNSLSKTRAQYDDLFWEAQGNGIDAKSLVDKQQNYLMELLEYSNDLNITDTKKYLIARVLLQKWYAPKDAFTLNFLRKTYVNKIVYGANGYRENQTIIVQNN